MTYLEENEKTGRIIFPDVVRAFAIFGIALVNVAYFSQPLGDYNGLGALSTPLDRAAYLSVNTLFLMKFYTLFAFMFGVGFAFQIASAERHGHKFGARYARRTFGLIILGTIHAAFLFQGDILFIYGIFGAVLFLFRNIKAAPLRRWAIALYIVQLIVIALTAAAMWAGETFDPESMDVVSAEFGEEQRIAFDAFASGGFWQATAQRLSEWSEYIILGTLIQGFGVLSFFLFGFAAVRSGVINDAGAPVWKRFRRIYLPIGLIGSFWGAYVVMGSESGWDSTMVTGMAIITLFAPFSTAGYLGLIAKWVNGPQTKFKIFMARGGTSSLTAYILQSVILSLSFNNYGLGQFGKWGAAGSIFIAAIVAALTIAFASLWRTKYKRGPMEYLLRTWTYLRRQ